MEVQDAQTTRSVRGAAVPILGLGGGRIKGNQHLRYPDRTPIANLHVALLNKVGIATEKFGDSTGQLTEI